MSSEVLRDVNKDVIPKITVALGEEFSFNPNTVIDPYDKEFIDFKINVANDKNSTYGQFVASFNRIIPHTAPQSPSRLDWEYCFDGRMTILSPSFIRLKDVPKLYLMNTNDEDQPLMVSSPYPSIIPRQHRYTLWTLYENDILLEDDIPTNVVPIRRNAAAPLTTNRRSMSSLRFKFE